MRSSQPSPPQSAWDAVSALSGAWRRWCAVHVEQTCRASLVQVCIVRLQLSLSLTRLHRGWVSWIRHAWANARVGLRREAGLGQFRSSQSERLCL